jgi:hypothetical protein
MIGSGYCFSRGNFFGSFDLGLFVRGIRLGSFMIIPYLLASIYSPIFAKA